MIDIISYSQGHAVTDEKNILTSRCIESRLEHIRMMPNE